MAFRLTGRHAIILSVVVVLVLAAAITFFVNKSSRFSELNPFDQETQTPAENQNTGTENQTPPNQGNNETSSTNGTRFVDGVTKIAHPINKDKIQKELDELSYASVSVGIDDMENVDIVLSSLSKEEFIFRYRGETIPAIVGNASQNGLLKLEQNPHVTHIYYNDIRGVVEKLQDSVPIIGGNTVWNLQSNSVNLTGNNVTVCLVDTGINYSHPDLGGCPRTNNITTANCSKVIGGHNYLDGNTSASDPMENSSSTGHGTHAAGIIAANGLIKGIAPNTKLVVIRTIPAEFLIVGQGVQWCIDHRNDFNPPIKIISISAGGQDTYEGVCDGLDDLVNAANNGKPYGISVFVASGNDYSSVALNSPACASNVTVIAATNKSDVFENYSNRNSLVDLLAPGTNINSTRRSQDYCRAGCSCSGNYMICSGTSFATPHVTGATALLLQLKSDLTTDQIIEILKLTGKNITDIDTDLNFSRIDVYKAISAVNDSLLRVNTLSVINYSGLSHFFSFTIQNANLSNITNISWSADMGDGAMINSTYNITQLLFHETALVRLKHNYSRNGIYIVNVSTRAGNLFHSKNITVFVGDLIVYDLKEINYSGWQRTFQFSVRNNLNTNITSLNWSLNFGEGTITSGNQVFTLGNKTDIFFRVRQNYSRNGAFTVTANATSTPLLDSKSINITIA